MDVDAGGGRAVGLVGALDSARGPGGTGRQIVSVSAGAGKSLGVEGGGRNGVRVREGAEALMLVSADPDVVGREGATGSRCAS